MKKLQVIWWPICDKILQSCIIVWSAIKPRSQSSITNAIDVRQQTTKFKDTVETVCQYTTQSIHVTATPDHFLYQQLISNKVLHYTNKYEITLYHDITFTTCTIHVMNAILRQHPGNDSICYVALARNIYSKFSFTTKSIPFPNTANSCSTR